jgi:putative hydrolase of the HAD superfamily
MAAKSAAGVLEKDWDAYNRAYVRSVGVPDDDFDQALTEFELTRNGWTWRWPIPSSLEAIGALHTSGMPLGVVSNASGQVEQLLRRSGVCQRGDGPLVPMRVIVDSHVVGVAKPDPRIFDFALEHFDGIDRANIGYVGDSVTMDIGGATAAGLYPILIDPYDDYAGASFARIRSLAELVRCAPATRVNRRSLARR